MGEDLFLGTRTYPRAQNAMHWVATKSKILVSAVFIFNVQTYAWALEGSIENGVLSVFDSAEKSTSLNKNSPVTGSRSGESGFEEINTIEQPETRLIAKQYLQSIQQLEADAGAYAPRLWEKMQGLAMAYFNQGKNEEAVPIFNRALHVYRINNGLYNVEQTPILRQIIDNFIVLKEFDQADNHHYYLYRTRLKNYTANDPEYLTTLREYAKWQREAYLMEVGDEMYRRLIVMHDLQTKALTIAESTLPENDIRLVPFLDELLDTQYLISSHPEESGGDSSKIALDKSKFRFLRLTSYSKGVNLLSRKVSIQEANPQATTQQKADAVVALGDWHQWNRRKNDALKMYVKAYNLLSENTENVDHISATFGRPKALPVSSVFDSTLALNQGKKKGYVVAQFAVTDYGSAREISFLDSEPKENNRNRWKLRKSIKATSFRPRFENAEPVSTDKVVHRYEFFIE